MRQVAKEWGYGRTKVLALWENISASINAGKSLSSIYRALNFEDLSYSQFNRLVAKYQKQYKREAIGRNSLPSPLKKEGSFKHNPLPQRDYFTPSSRSSKPQTFKHDPFPSKELIDSLKVSKGGGR